MKARVKAEMKVENKL